VEVEDGVNRWHSTNIRKILFRRLIQKVLFPSTIEDTIASVDGEGDVYQDNVRINSISLPSANTSQLKAIAAVMNSTLFNALARLKAGLSDSGWRQFNRQFAELVPFPETILHDSDTSAKLAAYADKIAGLQVKALAASSEGTKRGFQATLDSLWGQLDELVVEVYGLTKVQKAVVSKYPRRIDRFDLLTRQTSTPEGDE